MSEFQTRIAVRFLTLLLASSAAAQTHIARVGTRPDGSQIGADPSNPYASQVVSLSDDGRWVILIVYELNPPLAPLYKWRLLDRSNGSITELVTGQGGAPLDTPDLFAVALSGDGTHFALDTDASNVVAGDASFDADVFLVDMASHQVTRASNGIGGEPDSDCYFRAISPDGRYVTIQSGASNLVPNDTNFTDDIFRFDSSTGQIVRVSVGNGGVETFGNCAGGALSGDGRFVAFSTNADDLTPGDVNGGEDVYVRDLQLGTTTLVSGSINGGTGDSGSYPGSISLGGRYVMFGGPASDLVPSDNNGMADAFLRDLLTGTTTRLTVSSSGQEANGDTTGARLSGDGRLLVFVTHASNLIASDTNNAADIFVRDIAAGTTVRLNTTPSGGENAQPNFFPGVYVNAISADARFIGFDSAFSDLIDGDSNGAWDGFVADRTGGVAPVTTYCVAKTTSTGCTPVITSAGTPRSTGWDSFYISAAQVRANKRGVLAWSTGPASTPFGGGTLCLAAPLHYGPGLTSGSYGGTSGACNQGQFVFKVSQAFLSANAIPPGTTLYAQFLCRDNGFAQPNNVGLTNAIRFTVAP